MPEKVPVPKSFEELSKLVLSGEGKCLAPNGTIDRDVLRGSGVGYMDVGVTEGKLKSEKLNQLDSQFQKQMPLTEVHCLVPVFTPLREIYCRTHKSRYQVPIAELEERWTELPQVSDESRSFFRVHTGYFSNIPKCIKAEFIASWACSQSSVVSSSQR
ncbi:hypothetical protein TNCV_3512791 [Trichonephila clavipes]|nr:hypothetical protein TNCV_3512791 [Trichonephila clavipes]